MLNIFDASEVIGLADLGFSKRTVLARSLLGFVYEREIFCGMPKIPPAALECVFYLYEKVEEAKRGSNFGGSGFFVTLDSRIAGYSYVFAVTNWHVAVRDGASRIRVNCHTGPPDVFPFEPHEWYFDPRFDIAVIPVPLNRTKHKYKLIGLSAFTTKEQIAEASFGPGEDIFMVGRFVDHDGVEINAPAVRFGNVSAMPSLMKQPGGRKAEAYCIDLHSRTGYSGSPVFMYRTPGFDLQEERPASILQHEMLLAGTIYFGLLGIHFGQFPETWKIYDPKTKKQFVSSASTPGVPVIEDEEGIKVKGFSGMSCVLPSWSILEVLNMPALIELRNKHDNALEARLANAGRSVPEPESESAGRPANDANPTHQADFSRLLDLAIRTPPQAD